MPDGTLELLDGHLRAETTPEMEVPVLVVDLDDREAAKLLAVHDPLAGMAEANDEALAELLAEVETRARRCKSCWIRCSPTPNRWPHGARRPRPPPEVEVSECFQVVIECDGEEQQQAVYERMTAEGFKCRLLTL